MPTPRRRSTCGPAGSEDDALGRTDGRLVELQFSDKDIDRVREAYVDHVEAVDDQLGKLMDEVPDNTAVFVAGRPRIGARRAWLPRAGGADVAPAVLRDPVPDPPPERAEVRRRRGLVRLDARHRADGALVSGRHDPREDGRRGPDRAVRRRRPGGPARPAQVDHRRRHADHRPRPPLAAGGGPRAHGAAHVRR